MKILNNGVWANIPCHIYQDISLDTTIFPTVFPGNGNDITDWTISGNMVQSATPTPTNPVTPQECGERTENLFDFNKMKDASLQGYRLSETGEIVALNGWTISTYIPCDGYEFTLFMDRAFGNNPAICMYDENKTFLSGVRYSNQKTIILTSSVRVRYIRFSIANVALENEIMLNAGSTAPPYEPYGYKLPLTVNGTTTNIYLSEPIRKIGDYADTVDSDGVVTRRVKKLVLTGSASDPVRKIGNNAPYAYYYEPTGINGLARYLCLCTHVPFSWEYSGETPAIIMSGSFDKLFINFGKTTMDAQPSGNTVNGFKEFCAQQYAAGTPVIAWYVLATPTTEQATVPQIPTAQGSNTLDFGTTLKPSRFEGEVGKTWVEQTEKMRVGGEWV